MLRMSPRGVVGAVVLPLALGTLAACGGGSASAGGSQSDSGPITIGVVSALSGSGAESGQYKVNGAQLAVDEINAAGGVLGRKLQLSTVDDQTTNAGTVTAFSKLTSANVPVVIGPIRSTEVQAIFPDINRSDVPVVIGGTDPKLTHQGSKWVFRARPNDTYSAQVIAKFGVKDKSVKKWAVIHSTDAFGTGGDAAVVPDIKKYGGSVVLDQGYPNHNQDFTSVVLALKQSGAQGLVTYCTYATDCGVLAKQIQQQNLSLTWVGSPSLSDVTALKLAGPALYGTFSVADFATDANPQAGTFTQKYMAKYHIQPDNYSSWAYDAVNVIAKAIQSQKSAKPDAIAKGLRAIQGYKGTEGTYSFNQNGDALFGYNIVQNDNGTIKFLQHIDVKH